MARLIGAHREGAQRILTTLGLNPAEVKEFSLHFNIEDGITLITHLHPTEEIEGAIEGPINQYRLVGKDEPDG